MIEYLTDHYIGTTASSAEIAPIQERSIIVCVCVCFNKSDFCKKGTMPSAEVCRRVQDKTNQMMDFWNFNTQYRSLTTGNETVFKWLIIGSIYAAR